MPRPSAQSTVTNVGWQEASAVNQTRSSFKILCAVITFPLPVYSADDFDVASGTIRRGRACTVCRLPLPLTCLFTHLQSMRSLALWPSVVCSTTDLILILWPIFFVAATRQEPHLKPRDFKKPAAILARKPSLAGVTASLPRPLKRRMSTGGQTGRTIDIAEQQIERPYWEPPSPVIEVPAPRPLRGFWGWRRRPWVVSSPKVAPSCDTHC